MAKWEDLQKTGLVVKTLNWKLRRRSREEHDEEQAEESDEHWTEQRVRRRRPKASPASRKMEADGSSVIVPERVLKLGLGLSILDNPSKSRWKKYIVEHELNYMVFFNLTHNFNYFLNVRITTENGV